MALTDLLNTRSPAWRAWFDEHFPAVAPLQQAFREQALAMPDRHDQPRRASPLTLSMSGTGFEHRVRYLLDNEPPLDLAERGGVALASGAEQTDDDRRRLRDVFERFLDDHRARVAHIRPANRTLAEPDERTLAADCVVLGLLEQPLRAGESRTPELTRHFADLHGPDDLLAVVPPAVIDDMVALSAVGIARLGPLREAASTVAVAGSTHLDGANADMVIGDLLLELRVTTRPSLHREWLYQLLGSVLLDIADMFQLRTAGFYLPRQDALVTWPVAELLSTAAANPEFSVDQARHEFHAFLTAGTAADPETPAVPCG